MSIIIARHRTHNHNLYRVSLSIRDVILNFDYFFHKIHVDIIIVVNNFSNNIVNLIKWKLEKFEAQKTISNLHSLTQRYSQLLFKDMTWRKTIDCNSILFKNDCKWCHNSEKWRLNSRWERVIEKLTMTSFNVLINALQTWKE